MIVHLQQKHFQLDGEPDAEMLKRFQKYRADRILVLARPDSIDRARELWSSFKGNDSGEPGVPKGSVSTGDLPALVILKVMLDRKLIEAGWWRDVELRISASEGSDLQIRPETTAISTEDTESLKTRSTAGMNISRGTSTPRW